MKTEDHFLKSTEEDITNLTVRMDRFHQAHEVGIFRDNEPVEYVPITDEAYLTIMAKASIEGRDPGEIVLEVILNGLDLERGVAQ